MSNVISNTPISTRRDFQLGTLSFTERVVYWTIVLTPLWWLLGIQPLFYPAMITFLLLASLGVDKLIQRSLPACTWAWFLMSVVMLWTAMLGISSEGFSFKVTAATVVTFFKSYFLIFGCLALPFWSQIRVRVVTRAVVWLAIGFLINIGVQLGMLAIGIKAGYTPSFARLIPVDSSSLLVRFAKIASFFGVPLPRTALHTPDPPILGVCALLCFFICLGEANPRLRKLALAGSLCALVVSFSRLALICLPVALLLAAFFQSKLSRQLSLWLASLAFLVCSILELTLKNLLEKPLEVFNSARAASSETRAIVIRKTLEAWQEEPWLGWGVSRGKVWLYEDKSITLGSFSTYAAVLYLNGIVGFLVFICALVLTLAVFYTPAVEGNLLCRWAFVSLVALCVLMQATPLSWMAVYLWFFFLWLGAIMYKIEQDNIALVSWEQLSRQD